MSTIFNCILSAASLISSEVSLDAKTIAYLTAASLPTDDAFALVVNDYVLAIDAAGVFETDDEHYLLVNSTAAAARINLINPEQSLTVTSTPVFTQFDGYAGNGTDAVLTSATNLNALTNYQASDANIGISLLGTSEATNSYELGTAGGEVFYISRLSSANSVYAGMNGSNQTYSGLDNLSPAIAAQGYYIICDNGASEMLAAYQDGVRFTTTSTATYSTPTAPASKISILGLPVAMSYSSRKFGLFHIGASISDAQATARNAAYQAYLTAVSSL